MTLEYETPLQAARAWCSFSVNFFDGAPVGRWSFKDLLAVASIIVAVWTWHRSRSIEERIRSDADARSGFDYVFGAPFAARLEPLDQIIDDIARTATSATSVGGRAAMISAIQRNEHSDWFFALDALLSSSKENIAPLLITKLNEYFDRANDIINEISSASEENQLRAQCSLLRRERDIFLALSRNYVHEHRSSIRTEINGLFKRLGQPDLRK
ncbi:hypothetical protein [Acidimangrovimonas sediminis]|uniref:hypothetical protein n=1 Tax=Acidimangrovimonas sediminis TaxID=2056283 RepID=UPI0013049ECA|nr:hypothetical protein [Acidimangrovimonas sediminis]